MTTATPKVSPPHMSFAQTYILASKVRSKLTKEAASPKSSLRNLVVQANMLDNLMDYITEETERRNNYNQDSHNNSNYNRDSHSHNYNSTQQNQRGEGDRHVQFDVPAESNHGKSSHSDEEVSSTAGSLYKTSITEYELDSDSDSDSDSDYEEEEDYYDDYEEQEYEGDVSDEIKQLNGAIHEHATMSPHITTEEVTESDSEEEEEEEDDYYIYSDSEIEEDVATQAKKIPRTVIMNTTTSLPTAPSYKSLPFINSSSSTTPTIIEEDEEEEEEDAATDIEDSDDEGTIICESAQQQQQQQEQANAHMPHHHHDMPELCNTNSLTDDEYDDDDEYISPNHNYNHHHNHNSHYKYPSKTLQLPTTATTTTMSLFQHENISLEQVC
ncbi:unnamed protein product [Candida parapsilosis]